MNFFSIHFLFWSSSRNLFFPTMLSFGLDSCHLKFRWRGLLFIHDLFLLLFRPSGHLVCRCCWRARNGRLHAFHSRLYQMIFLSSTNILLSSNSSKLQSSWHQWAMSLFGALVNETLHSAHCACFLNNFWVLPWRKSWTDIYWYFVRGKSRQDSEQHAHLPSPGRTLRQGG